MSSGWAQLDLGGVTPRVPLPSFTAGLNGTSLATAALNSRTVRAKPATSISSLRASSSTVAASALVTSRIRYSSRRMSTTFWSKIWNAVRRGWPSTARPYFT